MDLDRYKNITYGIVAFIDILGFGGKVSAVQTPEDIRARVEEVQRIRKEFEFNTSDDLTLQVIEMYQKRVLAFSDSIIVHIPFNSSATEYEGSFDPILMQLSNFAGAQAVCVLNGVFLRAGIDLNWWYEDGDILVSEGLVAAYGLESRANVPVFALTDDLYAHFEQHEHRRTYHESIEPVAHMFRRYSGKDSRGKEISYWYLDYLRSFVNEVAENLTQAQRQAEIAAKGEERDRLAEERYISNARGALIQHAAAIKNAHAKATEEVRPKYVWLAEYHNEVVDGWGFSSDDIKCIFPAGSSDA